MKKYTIDYTRSALHQEIGTLEVEASDQNEAKEIALRLLKSQEASRIENCTVYHFEENSWDGWDVDIDDCQRLDGENEEYEE